MRDSFKKTFISLFFLLCSGLSIFVATSIFAATSGEELYKQGKYKDAYDAFTKADMDNPKKIYNRYNRGCAAVKIQDIKAGEAAFTSVLTRADDPDIRFRAFYNRGIAVFKKGDMESAIDDFKDALKLNPLDEDARFNFELALLKRKLSEQKKKEQKKDKDGQSDKSQDSSKSGDKEDKTGQKHAQDNKKDTENSQQNDKKQKNRQKDNTGEQGMKQETKQDKDLSGNLTGAENEDNNRPKLGEKSPVSESQMDRNKAEALLENVNDDFSVLMKAMKKQKKQVSKSGKKW